jgi:hypothetical protein
MKDFRGGKVLKIEGDNVLTGPQNCYDMNYHLYSKSGFSMLHDMERLIAIDDMPDEIPNEWLELRHLSWKEC